MRPAIPRENFLCRQKHKGFQQSRRPGEGSEGW